MIHHTKIIVDYKINQHFRIQVSTVCICLWLEPLKQVIQGGRAPPPVRASSLPAARKLPSGVTWGLHTPSSVWRSLASVGKALATLQAQGRDGLGWQGLQSTLHVEPCGGGAPAKAARVSVPEACCSPLHPSIGGLWRKRRASDNSLKL